MSQRFLNIRDILRQEIEVELETQRQLGGFCEKVNEGVDLLISLAYLIPKVPLEETDEYAYHNYFHNWFYLSIYTFRACFILFSRGYYFEAILLTRNLIEILAKMRYFLNHKAELQKIENVDNLKSGKHKVIFKKIFDEVFPGFYSQYKIDSHMAHGGIGARLMKMKINSQTDIQVDTGVFFNIWRAGYVVNRHIVFFLGYLRFYKKLFPEVIKNLPLDINTKLHEIEIWHEKQIRDHIKLKGGENDWHKQSRLIWDV